MKTRINKDQVILVNKNDKRIGVMDKIMAHKGGGRRHRAISVFLLNQNGELLIQKRSAEKIVGAHLWANTVCGNIWPNESRTACVKRRLYVELGIEHSYNAKELFSFEYHVKCNEKYSEWEIDHVFFGTYDGKVFPNPREVEEARWVNKTQLLQELKNNAHEFAPWFHLLMKDQRVYLALGWRNNE